jgi:glycosyltransferase involved in cell wall biosynthesis
VFANLAGGGVLEPGMSGGDRIAIESAKRWNHAFDRLCIITTNAGKSMYVRNSVPSVDYRLSTRIVLPRHSLLNNMVLQITSTIGSLLAIRRLLQELGGSHVTMYSSSDFLGDLLPALAVRILKHDWRWVATFYFRAPGPGGFRSLRSGGLRDLFYWLMQQAVRPLIKRQADMIFVTNEPDKTLFTNKNLDSNRIVAVRGGIDTKLPSTVPEPDSKEYAAVFQGRFHPSKGVLELVDIWALVCGLKKNARLALIGFGELENIIKRKIAKLGIERNIDILGFLDGTEKIKIFKLSRVALYPATVDHWSMSPVEAMSSGLPLVTFDLPTLTFLKPRGMIRTPCFDLQEFAHQIVRLLDDKTLYERVRSEALEWAGEWGWDSVISHLFQKIQELGMNNSQGSY